MGLFYENLTPEVRRHMADEIRHDCAKEKLYIGSYLSQTGQGDWTEILIEAVSSGTDVSLGLALRERNRLNAYTQRKTKNGYTRVAVPVTAHETLSEGEFNRFYCRGLCRYAIENGIERLEVYRAKQVAEPREESQRLIGLLVDPETALIDLRANIGVDLAFGIPGGPNSGISLRIPRQA